MEYTVKILRSKGFNITKLPDRDTGHLLLPVPSFPEGWDYLIPLLEDLPVKASVYGGFLHVPPLIGYRRVDMLADPYYLARNAAITAECAIEVAEQNLGRPISGQNVLILGWGRIGKCLGCFLRQKGANVSIAARNDRDLAMIGALGYEAVPLWNLKPDGKLILNTIPAMVLEQVPENSIAIELASKPGMAGANIISARGLPGKMRPEASGKLIAETFLRLSQNQEVAL